MIQPETPILAIAQVIQHAVAPVFLLTGIAAMLGVLVNRLARIVDRTRALEGKLPAAAAGERHGIGRELAVLARRAHLVNWAIGLCTTSALLVCLVIAVLFLGALMSMHVAGAIALLFVAAMLALIGALLSFLREVFLATAGLGLRAR